MNIIRSIIVEDDPKHAKRLTKLIGDLSQSIEILEVCNDIDTGFAAINKLKPDLVFLDIEMAGNKKAGFDLLDRLDKINFDIIFTTAHIDKNITDIRASGIDYIVKPYIEGELKDALEKFFAKKNPAQINQQKTIILAELLTEKKIWISDMKIGSQCFEVGQILYCKSSNQYTLFHINTGDKIEIFTSSKGIGDWEKELDKYNFCRIHSQSMINLKHIKIYNRSEGIVRMSNNASLDVSKSFRERFLIKSEIK